MPKKYFYGICQNCKKPTPKLGFKYCRQCFWNPERRFWTYIKKSSSCWEWTRAKNNYGYGVIQSKGKTIQAHRFAWIISFGKIPNGKCILHKCDNRSCIRPDHLFIGSKTDNNQDKVKKQRHPKGITHPMHKLSNEDVIYIRSIYKKYSRDKNQKILAKKFHIGQTNISEIVNNHTWKHLKRSSCGPS